jgi:uncharacterized protein YndB with AHSA1/START domain
MTDHDTTAPPDADRLGELTIIRILKAPRELAFGAFLDPEQLAQFWGPTGTHAPSDRIVVEPWVGGRFETVMVADDGTGEYPTKGVFTEIVPPERFAWTEESGVVTGSTFTDLGDGRTELTIHQQNLPAMYLTPEAQAGFTTSLDRYDAYLARAQS